MYKIAVVIELRSRGIPVEREFEVEVKYKAQIIDKYRLDIVVDNTVILELKAVDDLHPRHEARLLS